ANVPSHRALAMLRGRNEEVLSLEIEVDADDTSPVKPVERMIAEAYAIGRQGAGDQWLAEVAGWTWRVKLSLSLSLDLMRELREKSEEEAIRVFARNLKDLLLAAPAGSRATMGLDPGIRTGVKVAVVDQTGKLLDTSTVYPHEPRNDWNGALAVLAGLCIKHKLDVSLRGAVSIARRLQDPLAELVKIEPKAIGVGQYQHDVDQTALARSLDAAVEDCVNSVGVDVNMASAPLLARIA